MLLAVSHTHAGDPFVDAIESRTNAILGSVTDTGSLQIAWQQADALADYVAANASVRQLGALVHTESALRLLELALMQRGEDQGANHIIALNNTPAFRTQLALLVDPRDDSQGVLRIAMQLATERSKAVERFPALAAAVSVVHDVQYTRNINENRVQAPAAIEIFDYFTSNNARMSNDLSQMPALMLIHVVNVTESIEQLQWALHTYGNFPKVDDRFFEIDYDYDHFERDKPKKVTEAGNYCIESIKQYGGVCADQAYFAELVAKACGIPSCYVVARGADVSHAWIGFLEARGRTRTWNFDSGRYEAYQNLRGTVRNPQTGQRIPDGEIGLLAGLLREDDDEYLATAAVGLAVKRMSREGWEPNPINDLASFRGILKSPRSGAIDDRLQLMKLALAKCSSVPETWKILAGFAEDGQLDDRALDAWSRSLFTITGNRFPDFTFEILARMISAEEDPDHCVQMWEWAFKKYRARPDLASSVRMEQAALMESAGKPELAWAAYTNIVDNFLNDGPMGVEALRAMERLLESQGKRGAILPYLQAAAQKVKRPRNMSAQFASQSNYYKIQIMYANELRRSGNNAQADQIFRELGVDAKP